MGVIAVRLRIGQVSAAIVFSVNYWTIANWVKFRNILSVFGENLKRGQTLSSFAVVEKFEGKIYIWTLTLTKLYNLPLIFLTFPTFLLGKNRIFLLLFLYHQFNWVIFVFRVALFSHSKFSLIFLECFYTFLDLSSLTKFLSHYFTLIFCSLGKFSICLFKLIVIIFF